MIKHKKLLSRLIICNASVATAVLIYYLLVPSRSLTLSMILRSIAIFYILFAIVTVLQYLIRSKQIEKGKKKESDFLFWWEKKKL